VSPGDWNGAGPEFAVAWGGRRWSLKVDESNPGLRAQDERGSLALLSLIGLAEAGRTELGLFRSANLVSFELHRARAVAIYAPAGWGGVSVRAAWGTGAMPNAIDLEIQVTASSVGQLPNLEVLLESRSYCQPAGGDNMTPPALFVEPRDVRSAALSYDGREDDLAVGRLTTLPVPDSGRAPFPPRILSSQGTPGWRSYIEMAQPDDVARRITSAVSPTEPMLFTRYALFGHDLERGVVLRARLRGLWLAGEANKADSESCQHAFISEALPLGP
jgi:hypothetical protein